MPSRRFAAIVLIAVATLAGCGSSNDAGTAASASVDGDVVSVGAAPAPPAPDGGSSGVGAAVEVAAGAIGDADGAACSVDLQTVQAAVEAYELLNGALPASQQELVDAQLIREPSTRFEISPEGAIVASPGSPCS